MENYNGKLVLMENNAIGNCYCLFILFGTVNKKPYYTRNVTVLLYKMRVMEVPCYRRVICTFHC